MAEEIRAARGYERTRFVVLESPSKGRFIVDTFKKRMWSMRQKLFGWADVMTEFCEKGGGKYRKVMILLEYRPGENYDPGDISEFLKAYKQSLGDKLVGFAWVAELHKSGKVHYHLELVTVRGARIPMPDKSGMWRHGFSGIHTARSFYYVCKYVGKEYQKDLAKYPKYCHLYDVSFRGNVGLKNQFTALLRSRAVQNDLEEKSRYISSCVTRGYAEFLKNSGGGITVIS